MGDKTGDKIKLLFYFGGTIMFKYRKKYNDLIDKIIRLKATKEIYTEHLKLTYEVSDGNDEIKLSAKIKAASDLIELLSEILTHCEEKIGGIFSYRKKYEGLCRNIYLLKEATRVQRDQYEWRIDFDGSPAYSAEERSRLEGLYDYATNLITELNDILGIKEK